MKRETILRWVIAVPAIVILLELNQLKPGSALVICTIVQLICGAYYWRKGERKLTAAYFGCAMMLLTSVMLSRR